MKKNAARKIPDTEKESGAVRKSWKGRVSVCLVYPNRYHLAMSNLGFQTVYHQMNLIDHVVCERAFLPGNDSCEEKGVRSLESGRALREFDMIAFSISFENDFPHVLEILKKAGIPWESVGRTQNHPLIAAGGVAVFLNPEPVARFFDVFFIGEAEPMLRQFFERYDPAADRYANLLEIARGVSGVYAPLFYRAKYGEDGLLYGFEPTEDVSEKITRVFAKDISCFSTKSVIMTPDTAFSNSYLIEISRGCAHGCRFCGAGFIYRPSRFRPFSQLVGDMESGAELTDRIGLMGAAVSDHPDVAKLCEIAQKKDVCVSFSSLRADALSKKLIKAMKRSGVKTATIAPDAGSQRMRDVINKNIDEDHILTGAEALVEAGIPNLKLYFMIGLPTETKGDVDEIVMLCKKIKHRFLKSSRARKRIGEMTVSLNSFVPKPFTPFQWAAMDDISTLKGKVKRVKEGLKKVSNVRVHADVPKWSYVQCLFSRGDRRVADLIAASVRNRGNWPKTFKESVVNSEFYVLRTRKEDEIFPWDFIDHRVKKTFLWREYRRALDEKTTPPCPDDHFCTLCGACD